MQSRATFDFHGSAHRFWCAFVAFMGIGCDPHVGGGRSFWPMLGFCVFCPQHFCCTSHVVGLFLHYCSKCFASHRHSAVTHFPASWCLRDLSGARVRGGLYCWRVFVRQRLVVLGLSWCRGSELLELHFLVRICCCLGSFASFHARCFRRFGVRHGRSYLCFCGTGLRRH